MKQGLTLALLAGLVLGVMPVVIRYRGIDTLAVPDARRSAALQGDCAVRGLRTGGPTLVGAGGTLHDLGLLADRVSPTVALNDSGEVVGRWRTDLRTDHASHASEGVIADAGALSDVSATVACGINGRCQIVGWADGDGRMRQAFLFEAGAKREIGTLGGAESEALAINNSGQIVGRAALPDGSGRAFLYRRGVMQDLGTLGGEFSIACAINNAGEVAGWATTGLGRPHAFLYGGGRMIDLGTLGGTWSLAHGINAAGEVVGTAAVGHTQHAFRISRGGDAGFRDAGRQRERGLRHQPRR